MARLYTDLPGQMLYYGWVVHQRTSLNVVPWPGGTLTYQFECCTMIGWYTDYTRLNVVPWSGGTPAYQFECYTMTKWYTNIPA